MASKNTYIAHCAMLSMKMHENALWLWMSFQPCIIICWPTQNWNNIWPEICEPRHLFPTARFCYHTLPHKLAKPGPWSDSKFSSFSSCMWQPNYNDSYALLLLSSPHPSSNNIGAAPANNFLIIIITMQTTITLLLAAATTWNMTRKQLRDSYKIINFQLPLVWRKA